MLAAVNHESLGDLLHNVMCQLLIDNSAKRWLGELAPPAQAIPTQTIKTMGILFKCGVKNHPLVMALTGTVEPLLLRIASASESGRCCMACPSPEAQVTLSVIGGSGVLAVLQGKEFPWEDRVPCKALLMMQS